MQTAPTTNDIPDWMIAAAIGELLAEAQSAPEPVAVPDVAEWIAADVIIEDPQQTPSLIPFDLWPAQREVLAALQQHRQVIVLKARQLGITWLVIAFVLWFCLFHNNKTVIVISKDGDAADEVVRRAKGVYARLKQKPVAIAIDNVREVAWANGSRIKAFASTSDAGSSYTGSIIILDELAKNPNAESIYTSVKPTIDDGGAVIVVSTAKGEGNLFHKLWQKAIAAANSFKAIFIPWHARPGRTEAWYARVATDAVTTAHHEQEYPATPEQAFQSLADSPFLTSMTWWDACKEALPPLGAREPAVIALDAAVSNDTFALSLVTRHPNDKRRAAERMTQTWRAKPGGIIDYAEPRKVLNDLIARYNIVQVTYDPYQLHSMMTEYANAGKVFVSPFAQQTERLEADNDLRRSILERQIAHTGDEVLTQHVKNADAKVDGDSRKLRIVKREESLKIDAVVALSMARKRCMELSL